MPFICRHPVVGQQHRHLVAAQLQLAQRLEGLRTRLGADDAVLVAVPAPQVAGDGAGHAGSSSTVRITGRLEGASGPATLTPSP